MLSNKIKLIVIAIFVVLLGVGGLVANKLEAIPVGGSCANASQHDSCSGPDAACISADSGDYCSIGCKAAAECPAGWKCESITAETFSTKDGQKTKSEQTKMCVKP